LLKLVGDNFSLTFSAIESRYPDYPCVIPAKTWLQPILIGRDEDDKPIYQRVEGTDEPLMIDKARKVCVDRNAIIKAIQQALLCSNKTTSQVSLSAGNGILDVMSEDADYGSESRVQISCSSNNDSEFKIGFNGKMLLEILNTMPSGLVLFNFTTSNRATIIESSDNTTTEYLLMPVLLKD